MEKIFDIAKDSEKSWGVIAQGIDGNFEELSLKVDGTRRITGKDFYNGVYEYGTGIKDSRYNVVCGPSYELSNGEIDATNKLLWNHSLHINNGNVVFKINPINLVDNVLSLKMMINSIASSEKSVEVKIYNNTEPNNYYVYELMRANVNTVYGTWREYTIPSLAYWYNGKSVNLESIDRISISGVNCDFNVQYVGIKSNRLKKGIVTFTFDDGYKSQALAMKALAERGLSGTIFAIKDTFSYGDDSEFLNLNGFREVVDKYNADIECHGASSFDDMSDDNELATYMQQTKQILIDNGLGKGDYMAYPNGFHSDRVVNIAKRFFKACRTIQNYIPMETYPPYDLYRIRAYSNITSSSTDKIKQLIDRSVASGAWLILVYHKIEDGETGMYCSLESLEEVIDYAVNSGIRIMNFKDVFESGVVI